MLLNRWLDRRGIEAVCLGLFVAIGLLGAFNHVLWRDEMQGWLVAWRSQSWVELWQTNAPSGHPLLWSALIYLTRNLTGTPLSMQLLHWALGSLALGCFWRWCPLPKLQKICFTFGFYPFWDYFFICRQYVLAELLAFGFCSSYALRRKTYLPAALCIGLLTNSHALAWSLAFACGCTLVVDWCFSPFQRQTYRQNRFWGWDLGLSLVVLIALVGFAAFSLLQVRQVVDVSSSSLDLRYLLQVVGRFLGGYTLIIPNSSRWLDLWLCALISLGLGVSTLSFLRRSRAAFTFFGAGMGFLLTFNTFLYLGGGSRHYGYYFLILVAALWLALDPAEQVPVLTPSRPLCGWPQSWFFYPQLFTFCLAIHLVAGLHRVASDFVVPYSAGAATAQYIERQGWQDLPMVGSRDFVVTTVAGYLDHEIYYPELQDWGSYAQWNTRVDVDQAGALRQVEGLLSENPDFQRLLLIFDIDQRFPDLEPGQTRIQGQLRLRADRRFERSWHGSERYYLYWAELL